MIYVCLRDDPKCANAQADLNHRWSHMSKGRISDGSPLIFTFYV